VTEFNVGDIRVATVFDIMLPLDARLFFPDTTDDDWAPHLDWLTEAGGFDPAAGTVLFPVQSYLVRTDRHTILIDTCIGNDKKRFRGPWNMKTDLTYLHNLAAQGVGPDDIDVVLCTHLHFDHVGWNTRLDDGRWVPTFPNARHLFSTVDYEHTRAEAEADAPGSRTFGDSIEPIVEAGLAELVSSDHALDDQLWLEPTPGHTPGHYSVRGRSAGREIVFSGDLIHSPVQCRHPEWRANPDWDPELAKQTRRAFLQRLADTDTLAATAHFPQPSVGRIVSRGDAFDFSPISRG